MGFVIPPTYREVNTYYVSNVLNNNCFNTPVKHAFICNNALKAKHYLYNVVHTDGLT